jgi:MG2 domain/TonB-dependent Receptor Plug Domain
MCRAKLTVAAMFLFSSCSLYSQQVSLNSLDSLSGALVSRIRNQKAERSYISTDRSIYKAGEAVWFRVFLLNVATQKISRQNQPVFVECINEKNIPVSQLILHGGIQQPNGRFFLPDSISTGYYWIRAYTSNMRLHPKDNYVEQPIYVFSQNKIPAESQKATTESLPGDTARMDFFPEGGIMITGAPSLVAVRLFDKNEKGLADSAIIKDSRDLITTKFTTDQYGFGKFRFEPYHRIRYKAIFKRGGKDYSFALPPFNFFAGQISVSPQTDGSRKVRVLLEDSLFRNDFQTYLIAFSKDSVCFAGIGDGNYEVAIRGNKLPAGISTLFLFDKNMKLLSERSIYTREGLTAKAVPNKNIYSKGDSAKVNISIANSTGLPELTSFSISISDSRFIKSLRGNSKNADDWSLAENDSLTDEEADLIMLTKKDAYEKLAGSAASDLTVSNNDSLLYIHGTLKDKKNNALPGKIISLFSKKGNNIFALDTTDVYGRFTFRVTGYPDSTMFSIQLLENNYSSQNCTIEIDPFKFNQLTTTFTPYLKFDMEPGSVLLNMDSYLHEKDKILLQPVEVFHAKKDELEYDRSKRVSQFSHILVGEEIRNSAHGSVGNAVLSVPGIRLKNGFLVFGGTSRFSGLDAISEPLVIVDGNEVIISSEGSFSSPVLSYLNSLDNHNIDFIEVLSESIASNFGSKGANGVILVNSLNKSRQNDGKTKTNNLKTFFATGYQDTPSFIIRDNAFGKQGLPNNLNSPATIYWNGNVITDAAGNATINYYIGDVPGKYTGTIRGITDHGYVVYKTFSYEVQ